MFTWDGGSIEQKNTGSGIFISTPSISIDSSWVIFFDFDNCVNAFFTALLLLESKSPHTVFLKNNYNHKYNLNYINYISMIYNIKHTFSPVTATIFPDCTLFTSL